MFSSSKEMSYGSFNFVSKKVKSGRFYSVKSCPQPRPFKPVITMPQNLGSSRMF